MTRDAAPERPFGRSGVLRWALPPAPILALLALVGLGGCDRFGGGDSIALDSGEVRVEGSVHDVRVAGVGGTDSIAPATLEAEPGDAVRFITGDRRPHALTFTVDSLAGPVRDFLDRTGQLRGPPLVNEGAAWIVSLDGAPAGRYPFYCRSHDAAGLLTVTSDD